MRQRGFSLLEVLVAFSILALSLGILMRIYSGALNQVGIAGDQTEALAIAQSLLAKAGGEMPLAMGESNGRAGDRFLWQVAVTPHSPDGDIASGASPLLVLWEINVRVAWSDSPGVKEREVSLKTLRAQGRGAR